MIFSALLSHYRRHPVQAAFLLVSIVMANALLVGTQLINAQSRASYSEGEQVLNAGPAGHIRASADGAAIDEREYIRLRRQGFDMLAPVLRKVVLTEDGVPVEILGVDALSLPRPDAPAQEDALAGNGGFAGFSFAPYELWASPARLEQLGWEPGQRVSLGDGGRLPPARAAQGAGLGHRLLVDIGVLQELTGSRGQLSSIMVFHAGTRSTGELIGALPQGLEYVAEEQGPDPAELTRSFHLNLAAMGLLAFVVGIFLAYNALSFSYTDRHELLRKLRLSGVTRGQLRRALLMELALYLGAGSLAGAWIGAGLASFLLPGVGQTLAQLYGVYIAYPDSFAPAGAWMPLAMTAVAAALCVLYPMRQSLQAPLLERWTSGWQHQAMRRRDALLSMAGVILLLLSGLAAARAGTTWTALAGMACLLLGAALCLPLILRTILSLLLRLVPARNARAAWLLADSRWLLGPASVALMAMTLALVANSGLNTMISSFRQATDDWLQQRLAAQLYFRSAEAPEGIEAWLEREAPGVALTERYRTAIRHPAPSGGNVAVELVSLQGDERFAGTVRLIRAVPGAESRFATGEGVYVSERAWRIEGWQPGDEVTACPGRRQLPVLGVYHDYGNSQPQWMMSEALFMSCRPDQEPASLALVGPAGLDWAGLHDALSLEFNLQPGDLIDQAELRSIGIAVFDRTFLVTGALNALTLLVAGIGIFCAVSAIHHHRIVQQALLASLGVSRRERGVMLLLQWGLLGLLCMALVWPFGTLLAAYLAGVVTPVAFGWSFALVTEWQHYLNLAVLAAVAMMLAVVLPAIRLLRASPASLLRSEAVQA